MKEAYEKKQHRYTPEINVDSSVHQSFTERQNMYKSTKNKHKDTIASRIEKQIQDECTFSPKLNSISKDYKIETPAYIRLYEYIF